MFICYKNICLYVIVAVFFLLGTQNIFAQSVCARPVDMGWEPWPPFQYINSDGNLTGLDIALVKAIASQVGCTMRFTQIPWKRHLKEVALGRMDVAAGASKNKERQQYAHFSNPYRMEKMVLFIRKGEKKKYPFRHLKDIINSDFILGVTLGFYYGPQCERLKENPFFRRHLTKTSDDSKHPSLLLRHRTDGFLGDLINMTHVLKERKVLDNVEIHPLPIHSDDIYLMFSKKSVSKELISAFNQGLDKIKANGIYNKILNQYIK